MKSGLILKSFQSPGDIVMMSAAVRDLHAAYPGRFQTDVRTSADAIWENNPHLTPLDEHDSEVASLDMHYPLIHKSNERPYHFVHGYVQYLEQQLDLQIPVTKFRGDIHLADDEKASPPNISGTNLPTRYWIIVAGGKYDFTAKWWNPASYQAVVDHFRDRIPFVQCGEDGHWHPQLQHVTDLVGKTSLRNFIRLMYHADGVVCPVTLAMHLAAAVESKSSRRYGRPCVVVGGGREPAHWEAYPGHQYISTVGTLECCANGGCWKSRCQLVGDGDPKDRRELCESPVQINDELHIPKCMDMITPEEVIRRIELYHQAGFYQYISNDKQRKDDDGMAIEVKAPTNMRTNGNGKCNTPKKKISVSFFHGLGDCAYFAHLIPLYTRRGHEIEVECTPDKRVLFEAAGANTIASGASEEHAWGYPAGGTHEGHGRYWQGSKMGHNISEAPLPNIGTKEDLWEEYCDTRIHIDPLLPKKAKQQAETWFANLPRPVVLLHSKGNTAQDQKSLSDAITADFYREFIDRCDGTLILLDWDNRVPEVCSHRVRHLTEFGPCSTETMLAMMARADLMIGIDSGPLHASRFTTTPAVGIWLPGHYPTTYTLPRPEQLNLVLSEPTRQWNRYKRIPWNIIEHPGREFSAELLAGICRQMLDEPRYLDCKHIAADVQLQQFVRQWCRGSATNSLKSYSDRNRSFDVLLCEMKRRFATPTVVETGVIRAEEDWSGAGFFTYLVGAYLSRSGGQLHAVDISETNCAFARAWTKVFSPHVQVHQQDSVEFLRRFNEKIDVLYLDSLDTTEPNHAEHGLQEAKAALSNLHDQSVIVFDDTPWRRGRWIGKGEAAVPFLLANRWKVLYAGYQVVLTKSEDANK